MKHTASPAHQESPAPTECDAEGLTAEQRQFSEVVGRLLAETWRRQNTPSDDKRRHIPESTE